jgi:hypothetical protein
MKSLILTACILACTVGSANAQCTYRMNDVGRPHGYLSLQWCCPELFWCISQQAHNAAAASKKTIRPKPRTLSTADNATHEI